MAGRRDDVIATASMELQASCIGKHLRIDEPISAIRPELKKEGDS